jgi:hypothetical protein
MLERATGFEASIVEGRFMISVRHLQSPWDVIFEPDADAVRRGLACFPTIVQHGPPRQPNDRRQRRSAEHATGWGIQRRSGRKAGLMKKRHRAHRKCADAPPMSAAIALPLTSRDVIEREVVSIDISDEREFLSQSIALPLVPFEIAPREKKKPRRTGRASAESLLPSARHPRAHHERHPSLMPDVTNCRSIPDRTLSSEQTLEAGILVDCADAATLAGRVLPERLELCRTRPR